MDALPQYNAYPVPVGVVLFDPDFNCRGDFTLESVVELAESIREKGLKFPVVVQPWDCVPGYLFRLVAGFRRFRAVAAHLKAETIPAMIANGLDEFEARKLNLVENLERKDLNILQEAVGLRRLFPKGSCREIAQALNRQPNWVYIRLQLLDLPEKVQEMAAAGLLVYTDIETLHRMEGPPSIKTKAAERIIESRRKHKQRRPRGLGHKSRRLIRSPDRINKMVARMLEAGIVGLAPRVAVWCAGRLTDEELEADIQTELANRSGRNDPESLEEHQDASDERNR